ncbi:opine dehydrogenase-like [Haliotis rufescens]|uniref:opine dehydrogenase-like n=1 Tax=Haliotis rufescens TaxID=6454 RepID=UPI00201F2EA2|nr:opine dehydrogenase-like [Haliotis rufescens]
MKVTVLVCGGGNGAHVLAALVASQTDMPCRVLALSQAREWREASTSKILSCSFPCRGAKSIVYKANPHTISDNPAEVVPGADIIVLVVPAFSHGKYLAAIEPYMQKGTILVALPGQAGFDYQACHILRNKLNDLTIISAESLPWACRISEYGVKVDVIGVKELLHMYVVHKDGQMWLNHFQVLKSIFGPFPVLKQVNHSMELAHLPSALHLGIMYGKWRDWNHESLSENPLFYQGTDDFQAQYISDLDSEVRKIKVKLLQERPYELPSGLQWLVNCYWPIISDQSSLKYALTTNKAFDGLLHPMLKVGGGYIPDFKGRYLSEEVPFNLVVFKGLAQIVEVNTPVIDRVLHWSQQKLGKIYIVGSELRGRDLPETRAPQVYGIRSPDDVKKWL